MRRLTSATASRSRPSSPSTPTRTTPREPARETATSSRSSPASATTGVSRSNSWERTALTATMTSRLSGWTCWQRTTWRCGDQLIGEGPSTTAKWVELLLGQRDELLEHIDGVGQAAPLLLVQAAE